ncbi:hypothetical protein HDU77_000537 [Chytriomyces hyalinus]|nr:hypothetical protein HDU77_000537 [Chytriomyces hyalinus]
MDVDPVEPTEQMAPTAEGPVHAHAGPQAMDTEPQLRVSDISAMLPVLPDVESTGEYVHRWRVDDWAQAKTEKRKYSPDFEFGGSLWRILLFPNGNNNDHLSVFLDCRDAGKQPKDSTWHICLQFGIAAVNPVDESIFKHNIAQHRYNPNEEDWGFNHLCKLTHLYTACDGLAKPLVENNQLDIIIYMRAIKDESGILWHNFTNYDSKKMTGCVGLKNQGATCYMNSLLQSLYFVNYFRSAVFNIPTDTEEPTKSIPLALQRIFYQLQFSESSVGTTELTKSFGWDTLDSFMQHDVQEFNRVLQDNLETKMKGTKAEGAISRLFVGKYKSYIKCLHVQYESSRVEDFYDIQLNVKGFKNLRESFVDYVAVETLDGDNKYQAEGHGLQDARKGVIFTEFPPVLHLQLKRFEYDMERDAMVKINDRYEFPNEIDLSEFLDESVQTSKGPQKYILHGVLVHAGDVGGGHYCAFLRAEKDGKWFKFDDDRVTPVTYKDATEENFGVDADASAKIRMVKRFTNAYMLVYVRESSADEILKPITADDIPEHLRRRFDEERLVSEQKRKDREEQHLFFNIKYILDQDIAEHTGFDLCNYEDKSLALSNIRTIRVRKDLTLRAFKEMIAESLALPSAANVTVWSLVSRQNKTIRADAEITAEDKTLEQIKDTMLKTADFRFYIDLTGLKKPEEESCLIFLKRYDPTTGRIKYVGKAFFNKMQRIVDALPEIMAISKLEGNIKVYEEVKPGMIDPTEITKTFGACELGNGDILCVQNEMTPADIETLEDKRTSNVVFYFEDYRNRLPVVFKHKNREKEVAMPDLELVLSKKMTYDSVVAKLGSAIKWDANKIQLFSQSGTTKQAIKRSPTITLQEMTNPGYYVSNAGVTTLYFELLNIDLSVLETKRYLKVMYVDRMLHEHDPIDLLVSKTAKASEILDDLHGKLKIAPGGTGKLRLFEVYGFKIHRVFEADDFASIVGEFSTLYVEEIPAEEFGMVEGDKLVNVGHFNKEPSRPHGVPFKFVVIKGELFSATKARLIARAGIAEKDAAKAKFFIVSTFQKPKPIEDEDILSDVEIGPSDFLGIDHVDKSGRSARMGGERAIKIFNLDEEDASELKFGREFQDAQALLISEVKVLLEATDESREIDGASTDIKRKTVEYCARFSRFSDKHTIKEIRQLFPTGEFHQFETAQLANLGCETVEEAKILIPSLNKRADIDESHLQDLLDQMSNLRKFQAY